MKKYLLPIIATALCLDTTSAFAQKKGLAQAVDAAVTRQAAKQTVNFTPYNISNAPTNPALLLKSVLSATTLRKVNLSKLIPIKPTKHFDFTNNELLRMQQSLQNKGSIARGYRGTGSTDDKVTLLGFYNLLLKDSKGELSTEEQVQLRYLFLHLNPSVTSVERKLQSWEDKYKYTPTLPANDMIHYLGGVNRPPYGDVLEEWSLAADVYMLQQLYSPDFLPARIRVAQVLPPQERKQADFYQKLKKAQETVETLRDNGKLNTWWKEGWFDQLYDNVNKLALSVQVFYYYFVDRHLDVFPRAKYLKTAQEGRIYEIPGPKGLQLLEPTEIKTITPEEYVVFQADGENPILLKREDVELLTNLASYKEK